MSITRDDNQDAAANQYCDANRNNMNNQKIINVRDPENSQEAATKNYVDSAIRVYRDVYNGFTKIMDDKFTPSMLIPFRTPVISNTGPGGTISLAAGFYKFTVVARRTYLDPNYVVSLLFQPSNDVGINYPVTIDESCIITIYQSTKPFTLGILINRSSAKPLVVDLKVLIEQL